MLTIIQISLFSLLSFTDPFLHLPVTWPTVVFALITTACLSTDAPTTNVTVLISQKVYRHFALIRL